MTRAEFETFYEGELNQLEKRRYHLMMPLNIRTFESNGWRYKGYQQLRDSWIFIGTEERMLGADKLFRVHVPLEIGQPLIWEWDWVRNERSKTDIKADVNGPKPSGV